MFDLHTVVERIRKIIKEEASRGAIVIVASHNPMDLEVCDKIIELDSEKLQDISDLTLNAEVIKGHLVEDKKSSIYYECVLSEVEIDEVYMGELQKGEHIYVFEPVDCRRNQLDCTDGYSLMDKQEEYVLFLSKLKNAGYGDGEYVYAPMPTTFEKFLYKDSVPTQFSAELLENPEQMSPYSKCENEEVYLYDDEMYNKYCRLKKQVLEFVKVSFSK